MRNSTNDFSRLTTCVSCAFPPSYSGKITRALPQTGRIETRSFPHTRQETGFFFPSFLTRLITIREGRRCAASTNGKPSLYAVANTAVDLKLHRRRDGEGGRPLDTRANYPYCGYDKSWLQFALYYLQYCFLRNPPSASLSLSLPPSLSSSILPVLPPPFIPITPRPRGNRSPPLSDDTARRFYV